MGILIKKMETEEEIKGKAYVHWRSWSETYPGLISQQILDAQNTLERCVEAAFRWPDHLLVAKDGDRVIGFVGYGHRDEDPSDIGEVFALYVLAEFHGKDVGRQLMEAALEQPKEYRQVRLWTLKENSRAIRFYQKCGFVPDGEEKVNARIAATEIRMVLKR